MVYAETSGHRNQAQVMVDEAFGATTQLMDQINPAELRSWYVQFESVYTEVQNFLIDDPVAWSRFLGSQCDLLHQASLHQKTILSIGDEMAKWDRKPIPMNEFGDSLDGFATLMVDHSDTLGHAIERQAGNESTRQRRAVTFSHALCGLSVVLLAVSEAIKVGDPRDANCSAFAMFGASLTCKSVARLYEVCKLSRV